MHYNIENWVFSKLNLTHDKDETSETDSICIHKCICYEKCNSDVYDVMSLIVFVACDLCHLIGFVAYDVCRHMMFIACDVCRLIMFCRL